MTIRNIRANAPLLAVVAVVAVALIRVGLDQFIDYDGWIHIFISRSESVRDFYIDWLKTTQPPLFFLLLKVLSFLGTSRIAYRLVPIIAGLVAVFMVGKIAERITSSRIQGVLAAAGYGLTATNVIMSCEVRSYTLAIAFVLIAFHYYLKILSLEGAPRDGLLFSASVIVGIVSLYGTALFYVAAALSPLVIALFRPHYRRELISYIRARKWIVPATFAAPAMVLAIAYRYHMWRSMHPLNYMPQFYFDPARGTLADFILNGIRQEANLFSPFEITSERMALPLLVALLAAAVVALVVTLRDQAVATAAPVVVLVALVAQIIAASALGKYPLGGQLRHQFLIFPFIVLSCFSIAGVAIRNVERTAMRHAIIAVLTLVVGANAIAGYLRFPISRQALFLSELQTFRSVMPTSMLLFLDEYSTVAFFSHHHAWNWHLAGSDGTRMLYYEVTKGARSMQIVRSRYQWNLQPFDRKLYGDLKRAMERGRARSIDLFGLEVIPAGISAGEAQSRVAHAAATQQLAVDRIVVEGRNLYARLIVQ